MQTFSLLTFVTIASLAHSARITLFEEAWQKGKSYEVDIPETGCANLYPHINDKATSVNTQGHCVRLYEHGNCEGRLAKLAPGCGRNQACCPEHGHLGQQNCHMDKKVSSIKSCRTW